MADIIPIWRLTRRFFLLIAAHCLSGERLKNCCPPSRRLWGRAVPLTPPAPTFSEMQIIPASHKRLRLVIAVRPTSCNGLVVVGVRRKNRASMTGADGSFVRLSGCFGVWMLDRRKAGSMRSGGFALRFPSKGRWFTPLAFVVSGCRSNDRRCSGQALNPRPDRRSPAHGPRMDGEASALMVAI